MASPEEIEETVTLLEECGFVGLVRMMNETSTGIAAVLRFLRMADGAVTAGQISAYMNVSTARVAVLLRKMEAKGLIVRRPGPADARTTVVTLSAQGRRKADEIRMAVYRRVGELIDRLGAVRMVQFAQTAQEIQSALLPPPDL